jgi:putative NIF3 family GTP cyclohydrolase 1 type 2
VRADHLTHVLTTAIPWRVAWDQRESYGPYNLARKANIDKVLYAVTPTKGVEDYFNEHKYNLLVSHHPYHTRAPQMILHTALDCCEGGLNDQWRDALGIQHAKHFDGTLGWHGQIQPIHYNDLCGKVEAFAGYPILGQKHTDHDNPVVRSAVVCSGLGGLVTDRALRSGADCYVLGEAVAPAHESGFKHMIETGHTNSEWCGVNLIRKLLQPHNVQVDLAPHELDHFSNERYTPRVSYHFMPPTNRFNGGKTLSR